MGVHRKLLDLLELLLGSFNYKRSFQPKTSLFNHIYLFYQLVEIHRFLYSKLSLFKNNHLHDPKQPKQAHLTILKDPMAFNFLKI